MLRHLKTPMTFKVKCGPRDCDWWLRNDSHGRNIAESASPLPPRTRVLLLRILMHARSMTESFGGLPGWGHPLNLLQLSSASRYTPSFRLTPNMQFPNHKPPNEGTLSVLFLVDSSQSRSWTKAGCYLNRLACVTLNATQHSHHRHPNDPTGLGYKQPGWH